MAGKMNATAAAEPMRKAYVTFLPGADDAREGLEAVVRLAEDLRKVGAAYQLVVAVLPDAPESHRRILVSQGCVVREVEPVYPPPEFSAMAAAPRYSMLRVWEVTARCGLIHGSSPIFSPLVVRGLVAIAWLFPCASFVCLLL
jgi:inositol 3-alpha-galactosyltransferase